MARLEQEHSKPVVSPPLDANLSQDAHTAAPNAVLKDGTPVQIKFARKVICSQVIAGEKLPWRVVDEVRVGDLLAIQTDSIAEAMVTLAQSKSAMGRGGNLEIKIESVHLSSGETAPLRTIKDVKGEGHKAAMIAGMVLAGVVYLPGWTFF